ncbi:MULTISPECIES: TM2 domain-containing protein [unclassified Acidovorax]|uniref:TM2 domain-containing protein n=1 Tax=unclassified Acidovorax TaxID=2684926 RepID=UPI0028830998|nr:MULTISPECIES: TM2 domain-containing protein [unclassified Acidovorax]
MRGQILVFNEQKEAGAIVTEDGRRLIFHINDWQDVVPPDRGMAVSFMLDEEGRARQVQLTLPDPTPSAATATPTPPSAPPLALRPKRKPVITLFALFLGFFGAHRFYMGAWGWGLVQLLGAPIVIGILFALLPPLGGLLYFAAIVFVWTEAIRYIWMTDAEFDAKVRAYQAARPGPFAFFW